MPSTSFDPNQFGIVDTGDQEPIAPNTTPVDPNTPTVPTPTENTELLGEDQFVTSLVRAVENGQLDFSEGFGLEDRTHTAEELLGETGTKPITQQQLEGVDPQADQNLAQQIDPSIAQQQQIAEQIGAEPGTGSPGDGSGGVGLPPSTQPPASQISDQGQQTDQTQQQLDLNVVMERALGHAPSEDEVTALVQLYSDFRQLTPQQRDVLNGQLYGQQQYQPPVQSPVQPLPQQYTQPIQQPYGGNVSQAYGQVPQSGYPTQQPNSGVGIPGQNPVAPSVPEFIDPELAQTLNPIVQQQLQIQQTLHMQQQQMEQMVMQQQMQQQQRDNAAIQDAQQSWRQEMAKEVNLLPEEWVLLDQQVRDSGSFPHFYNMAGGDARRAVTEAYNHFFYTNPDFKDRLIAQQVTQRRAADAKDTQRQAKSTALSGASGVIPREQPNAPSTATGVQGMTEVLQELGGYT